MDKNGKIPGGGNNLDGLSSEKNKNEKKTMKNSRGMVKVFMEFLGGTVSDTGYPQQGTDYW